ncbi:hypothetical protein ASPZODRAFT_143583 [Penicilliopsis zonata CBS 506.65]|uniref:Ubiquitin-like domain-containing protein n=1 Tax=Penicilliopsis zonata CBS 506.65 TaxID=1073090 RepID=A0A1L9SER2_9EURO|nr:hypothetical protein ASPZODRAFT_143583 [Penicilliopsis zonata CBS 506.65]OJJ45696.1 hypothetical protein ASPZODRAFT_143583 [Penicilliopsis zonata CBS 506.65]
MNSDTLPSDERPTSATTENAIRSIALHILCPSLPPPNRFTFKDLHLSTTVAELKARISETLPSQPPAENQRLIYRGKSLSNNVITLQEILSPIEASEYTMHLALPPDPSSSTNSPAADPSLQGPSATPLQQNPFFSTSRINIPNQPVLPQGLRFRGPMASTGLHEADIGAAIRRNIENMQRQIAQQERARRSPQNVAQGAATGAATHTSSTQSFSSFGVSDPPNPQVLRDAISSETAFPSGATEHILRDQIPSAQLPNNQHLLLRLIQQQIALAEEQVSRGVAPPLDHIIWMRSQLLSILDNQYRNPDIRRQGSIESLLTRVFNISTRADQLRIIGSRSTNMESSVPGIIPDLSRPDQPSAYFISSPDGFQGLVVPPDEVETIQRSIAALNSVAAHIRGQGAVAHTPHANGDAMMVENVVRQAVLNQRGGNNGQFGFARNIRRFWLFARLYFFCYLFSEPGTWSRIIFVTLAVLVALASETSVPRQLHGIFIAPVQRHLEGLVHFRPDEHLQHSTQENARTPVGGAREGPVGWRQNLRRLERSVVLLLASLVPGVGERQIEVRNAAERAQAAEAERLRQEAEQRVAQQEQEPEQRQQEDDRGDMMHRPMIPRGEEERAA